MDKRLSAIFNRRSIRKYQPDEIDQTDIQSLLEAAMAAPSACCKDPWRFVVIQDKEMLNKMAEGLPNGPFLTQVPLAITVCGDIEKAHDNLLSYMLQDCSAAIQNILLAADMMGLGACWLGIHPRENRIAHLRSLLELPENIIPIGVVVIGKPVNHPEARTRYNGNFVHAEKWS
jgi:nitroreductase